MKAALIIVDPQNDFCLGGPLQVPFASEIFPIINRLKKLSFFQQVYITQDWHPEGHYSFANTFGLPPFSQITLNGQLQTLWPVHCLQNQIGSEISKELNVGRQDQLVHKGIHLHEESYSGFGTEANPTELCSLLKQANITDVFVVGLAFDYCVGSTALDAVKNGFNTFIVKEATKAVSAKTELSMNIMLEKTGVNLIEEWMLQ